MNPWYFRKIRVSDCAGQGRKIFEDGVPPKAIRFIREFDFDGSCRRASDFRHCEFMHLRAALSAQHLPDTGTLPPGGEGDFMMKVGNNVINMAPWIETISVAYPRPTVQKDRPTAHGIAVYVMLNPPIALQTLDLWRLTASRMKGLGHYGKGPHRTSVEELTLHFIGPAPVGLMGFKRLLARFEGLKRLDVRFGGTPCQPPTPLAPVRLPELDALRISYTLTNPRCLTFFVAAGGATLCHLKLTRVVLTAGTWAAVAQRVLYTASALVSLEGEGCCLSALNASRAAEPVFHRGRDLALDCLVLAAECPVWRELYEAIDQRRMLRGANPMYMVNLNFGLEDLSIAVEAAMEAAADPPISA